jgi:CRISPR/Cas system CMR-associated protein Cmr1 (group 7 of RAMP superfamily)
MARYIEPKNRTIFNNMLDLDCFCLDIIEQAKLHYADQNRVKRWLEEDLVPAMENAIEDIFLDGE